MSLTSKAQAYDVLVKELFRLLDLTEESDEGREIRPIKIICSREQDLLQLEKVLVELKRTLEYWG